MQLSKNTSGPLTIGPCSWLSSFPPLLGPLRLVPASLPSIMQYCWFLRPLPLGARCSALGAPCESILTHMVQYCQALSATFFKPSSWPSKSSAIENILKTSDRRVLEVKSVVGGPGFGGPGFGGPGFGGQVRRSAARFLPICNSPLIRCHYFCSYRPVLRQFPASPCSSSFP